METRQSWRMPRALTDEQLSAISRRTAPSAKSHQPGRCALTA